MRRSQMSADRLNEKRRSVQLSQAKHTERIQTIRKNKLVEKQNESKLIQQKLDSHNEKHSRSFQQKMSLISNRATSAKFRNSQSDLKTSRVQQRRASDDIEVRRKFEKQQRDQRKELRSEYREISALVKKY